MTDKQSLELLANRHVQLSDNLAKRIAYTGETDAVAQDRLIFVKYMVDSQLWELRFFMN